jgi:hypothetical protein
MEMKASSESKFVQDVTIKLSGHIHLLAVVELDPPISAANPRLSFRERFFARVSVVPFQWRDGTLQYIWASDLPPTSVLTDRS